MLYIEHWSGRLGNNILQLLIAIHYACVNNYNVIKFNKHNLLSKCYIYMNNKDINNNNNNKDNNIIKDTFTCFIKFNILNPEPYTMKAYFQKYITPIFKINNDIDDITSNDSLYLHIRSGDLFNKYPHPKYVPPPISYYTNIITNYKKTFIISESTSIYNEILLKNDNIEYIGKNLYEDLIIFANAENIAIGVGTFGLLFYFMNIKLKNLYIPKYSSDNWLPGDNWGDNINVYIIDLPNYIKLGEWKNTPEQLKLMLTYN